MKEELPKISNKRDESVIKLNEAICDIYDDLPPPIRKRTVSLLTDIKDFNQY